MAWVRLEGEERVTEHVCGVSGQRMVLHWGSGIKCLLGSSVNVSNLTLLGRDGGGAAGWGREGTQKTRRPGPIHILDPGASPSPSCS